MTTTMPITAYRLAERFVGMREVPGSEDHPQILAMLQLDAKWPDHDEVPWCSGFVNYIAWLLRLPRSKSLRARSWLEVGEVLAGGGHEDHQAQVGWDVVILQRGSGQQPGPEVIDAPGHVGFFAGWGPPSTRPTMENPYPAPTHVHVLGGNQGNRVSVQAYPIARILGVRRLR